MPAPPGILATIANDSFTVSTERAKKPLPALLIR